MTDSLWIVAAYALQLAALVGVAFAVTSAFQLRVPRHSLRFWQTVMAIALLLPLAQPRRVNPASLQRFTQSISTAAVADGGHAIAPAAVVDYAAIILIVLAAGMVARLLWLGVGLLRLRSLVARATPDDSLRGVTADLTQSIGVAAEMRISDDLDGPATVGLRRPLVLLPRSVLRMSTAVQRAIICHELLHVKRRDWLQTMAEEIWCAVLWFHPLARVIASQLSMSREMVVDEATIHLTRDRRAYAEALLAFSNPQPHVIGITPFIGRRTLSQRISLIAEEGSMSRRHAALSVTIALAAAIGTAAAAVDRFPMFATLSAQSVVHKPGNGVTLPEVVHEVKAEYTAAAMQARIEGSLYMDVVVSETGDVAEVTISRSLDKEYGLDQAAIDAARQWKFKPGQKDGKAVAVQVEIEMRFRLK